MRMPNRHVSRSTSARRAALLGAALAACAAILPASAASAAPASSPTGNPTLDATLAQANKLAQEIDSLSQQYDSLQIQLRQAKQEAKIARANAKKFQTIFAREDGPIEALAVESYMSGSLSPTLQLLTTSSPQDMLNRASIMAQLQSENGAKVSEVANAAWAAQRALGAAGQQERRAKLLSAQIKVKVNAIQTKANFFNSTAFKQAAAIYQKTGSYPNIQVTGDSIGVQALRFALTKVGDPYVWGAAGPNAFDCSGLVKWAYAQVGISLLHFTGDQWNEGEHISRAQLAPGDLVFFFADLSHVGMYIGNGLMVDAPTFGIPVHVEPVFWSAYEGAVRIVA